MVRNLASPTARVPAGRRRGAAGRGRHRHQPSPRLIDLPARVAPDEVPALRSGVAARRRAEHSSRRSPASGSCSPACGAPREPSQAASSRCSRAITGRTLAALSAAIGTARADHHAASPTPIGAPDDRPAASRRAVGARRSRDRIGATARCATPSCWRASPPARPATSSCSHDRAGGHRAATAVAAAVQGRVGRRLRLRHAGAAAVASRNSCLGPRLRTGAPHLARRRWLCCQPARPPRRPTRRGSYQLPAPVDEASAERLAVALEQACASAWRYVLAQLAERPSGDPTSRPAWTFAHRRAHRLGRSGGAVAAAHRPRHRACRSRESERY